MREDWTNGGSFISVLGLPPAGQVEKSWSGLTWEITPSIYIPSGTSKIELGVRLAGFPTFKQSGGFSEFKWNPFVVFLGVHF